MPWRCPSARLVVRRGIHSRLKYPQGLAFDIPSRFLFYMAHPHGIRTVCRALALVLHLARSRGLRYVWRALAVLLQLGQPIFVFFPALVTTWSSLCLALSRDLPHDLRALTVILLSRTP